MSRRDKRRPHVREPKPIFYLLCEGANTEPGYFRALEQAYPNVSLDISAVGVPKTVAEQAVARAKTAGVAPKSKKPRGAFAQNDSGVGSIRTGRTSALSQCDCALRTK